MAYRQTLRLTGHTDHRGSKGLGLDVQSGNSVLGQIQRGPFQQLGFADVCDCTYEGQESTLCVIPQAFETVFH